MPVTAAITHQFWLRNQTFDIGFIIGVLLLAVLSGLLVLIVPESFIYVLNANLWLLGYRRVASTNTRLAFDSERLREHQYKLTVLLIFMAVVVAVIFPLLYQGVCFALSSGIYFLIERFGVDIIELTFGVSSLAASMFIYQTIIFHHYIVDASNWKLRKKPIRSTLGINNSLLCS